MEASLNSSTKAGDHQENTVKVQQIYKTKFLKLRTRKKKSKPSSWLKSRNAPNYKSKSKKYRDKSIIQIKRTNNYKTISRKLKIPKRNSILRCKIQLQKTRNWKVKFTTSNKRKKTTSMSLCRHKQRSHHFNDLLPILKTE